MFALPLSKSRLLDAFICSTAWLGHQEGQRHSSSSVLRSTDRSGVRDITRRCAHRTGHPSRSRVRAPERAICMTTDASIRALVRYVYLDLRVAGTIRSGSWTPHRSVLL
jgi:hypothetical protein